MTPSSTSTTSAKPKPQVGRVRLDLTINGQAYSVRPVAGQELPPGGVRGFTLTRVDRRQGKVRYMVAERIDGLTCSCADQKFRRSHGGTCKHLAAASACGLF